MSKIEYITLCPAPKGTNVTNVKNIEKRIRINGYQLIKKGDKDQELIQSSSTPDPEYRKGSDKNTMKHHKQEPRGQPFPSK